MNKLVIAGALVALGLAGAPGSGSARPAVLLHGEQMTLEYNPGDGEVAFVVSAESEAGLDRVEVKSPSGASLLRLRASEGSNLPLNGFRFDSDETDLAAFLAAHPEGVYTIVARTVDGQTAAGSAIFSHALLPAPIVAYPLYASADVPTQNATVTWQPHSGALWHRVVLEQGEDDLMSVELGAGASSFQIPDKLLQPGTRYYVEVASVAANGNMTVVKIPFMTQ